MDEMEMNERGAEDREAEEQQQQQEEETSFNDDDQQRDESILIIDTSNPVFVRPDDNTETSTDKPSGSVPDAPTRHEVGVLKRYMIHDKKQFLKNGLGISVNKGDGPNSTILYDELNVVTSEKGKINGAKYKGKKILKLVCGKFEYTTDRSKLSYVNEFKDLLKKADKEYRKTPASRVEKTTGVDVTQETVDSIVDSVHDRIESRISDIENEITADIPSTSTGITEITENELREFRGILNVKINDNITKEEGEEKIRFLTVEKEHWKAESEKSGISEAKSKFYDGVTKVAELKIEQIRLKTNQLPETEEVQSMLDEEVKDNDMKSLKNGLVKI